MERAEEVVVPFPALGLPAPSSAFGNPEVGGIVGAAPLFEPVAGVVFENHFDSFDLFEPGADVVIENHFEFSWFSFFPLELLIGGFAHPLNVAIVIALVAVSRTLCGVSVSSPLCARATARMAT